MDIHDIHRFLPRIKALPIRGRNLFRSGHLIEIWSDRSRHMIGAYFSQILTDIHDIHRFLPQIKALPIRGRNLFRSGHLIEIRSDRSRHVIGAYFSEISTDKIIHRYEISYRQIRSGESNPQLNYIMHHQNPRIRDDYIRG